MPLGVPELIIILVVVVLIFGVGKLPEVGSGLGKGIREFKDSITGLTNSDSPKDAADQVAKKLEDGAGGVKAEVKEAKQEFDHAVSGESQNEQKPNEGVERRSEQAEEIKS